MSAANLEDVEMLFMEANIRQRIYQCKPGDTLLWLPKSHTHTHNQFMEISEFGKRLKRLMAERGEMSQYALAKQSGVPQPTIQRLLKGETKHPSSETLTKLAKALSVDLSLMVQEHPSQQQSAPGDDLSEIGTPIITWEKPEDLPEGHYVVVPRYDVHVSAGNGHVVYDERPMEQGHAYRTRYIKEKGLYARNLISIYAVGTSMEPRIRSGDSLLIDRSQTAIKDGLVYVLSFGGEVKVKRLFKRPDGGLLVVSDNKIGHTDMTIEAKDMPLVTLIGEVIEVSGPP